MRININAVDHHPFDGMRGGRNVRPVLATVPRDVQDGHQSVVTTGPNDPSSWVLSAAAKMVQ
jgi:hypothetical protein